MKQVKFVSDAQAGDVLYAHYMDSHDRTITPSNTNQRLYKCTKTGYMKPFARSTGKTLAMSDWAGGNRSRQLYNLGNIRDVIAHIINKAEEELKNA